MSEFEKRKKALQDAKSALLNADRALVMAKATLEDARPKVKECYETLTDTLAMKQANEASDQDVEEATQRYEQAEKTFEDAKTGVIVKEKAIPIFRQKVEAAWEAFKKPAYAHYKAKSAPLIDRLLSALADIHKIQDEISELSQEMKALNVEPSVYLPAAIDALKIQHLRHPTAVSKFIHELNELKR